MKDSKCKPEMYNSYNCDSQVVRVNEYSTISKELVSEIVESSFLSKYNCVVVTLRCFDYDQLDEQMPAFLDFCSEYFTLSLLQHVGMSYAIFSVLSFHSLSYIAASLYEFSNDSPEGCFLEF